MTLERSVGGQTVSSTASAASISAHDDAQQLPTIDTPGVPVDLLRPLATQRAVGVEVSPIVAAQATS
jgi:hypothetical protein